MTYILHKQLLKYLFYDLHNKDLLPTSRNTVKNTTRKKNSINSGHCFGSAAGQCMHSAQNQ